MEVKKISPQERWDKEHIKTISTRINIKNATEWTNLCIKHKTNSYKAIKDFVMSSIKSGSIPPRPEKKKGLFSK